MPAFILQAPRTREIRRLRVDLADKFGAVDIDAAIDHARDDTRSAGACIIGGYRLRLDRTI